MTQQIQVLFLPFLACLILTGNLYPSEIILSRAEEYEVPVLVTFESNWEEAERILQGIIAELSPDRSEMEAAAELRATAEEYRIKMTGFDPAVWLSVSDSGILLTARLVVEADQTRSLNQAVWRAFLKAIAGRSDIALAYPTIRTYFQGPIETRERRGED